MDDVNIIIPWVLAALTAVLLFVLAKRAGRSPLAWAVYGLLFGLVGATIVFGVGQASSIPFSSGARTAELLRWTLLSIGVIGIITWLLSRSLRKP